MMNRHTLKPPRLAEWLLEKLLKTSDFETIIGDLGETYHELCVNRSKTAALRWYWLQILSSLPRFVKNKVYRGTAMVKNYLKIALRNFRKHKLYTAVNISGLTIGIASCLLIFLYIQDEIGYDTFHEKSDRIYRVLYYRNLAGLFEGQASVPFPAGPALKEDYPQIEKVTRFYHIKLAGGSNGPLIVYKDKKFKEKKFFFGDASIFDIFDIEFVKGSPETALIEDNDVIITEETARKYFGEEEPIGKVLMYLNTNPIKVTAVVKNLPLKSHIHFDFLTTIELRRKLWMGSNPSPNSYDLNKDWFWNGAWAYLLLKDKSDASQLEKQLPEFVKNHYPESIKGYVDLRLQPLTDIHLRSDTSGQIEANGNIVYVYVFSTIAVLILLIACINFMNLATANSATRAKEIGMRKVMGAYRSHLINQFLGESILMTLIGVVLAVGIVHVTLPAFNEISGKSLTVDYFQNWWVFVALAFLSLFVGILSGSYPAFFHSAFRPIAVLRGALHVGTRTTMLRKVLVTGQFVVSIMLIIGVLTIFNQLQFMQNKDLGFQTDRMMVLTSTQAVGRNYEAFKNELLQHPDILDIAQSGGGVPGKGIVTYRFLPEGFSRETPKPMYLLMINDNFVDTFGLDILSGRNFSQEFPNDRRDAFIINETAARELGWEGNAVGKTLEQFGGGSGTILKKGKVVGVVKDFHFESLHEPIKPLVFTITGGGNYVLKVSGENLEATLDVLQKTWDKFETTWPLEYYFLEENISASYTNESKLSKVVFYFSILAIVVACLGLLGLVSFMAEKRMKEIGIRKVLGASISTITALMSREFIVLVTIANAISWPLAYIIMNAWLKGFAYRMELSAGVFLLAGLAAISIALVTVSFQSIKAALSNPVKVLRLE